MINAIPFIGWFIAAVLNISLAIPFWFCWTVLGLGQLYFDFLPQKFQSIPFWNCVGLFTVISILKVVLIPRGIVSASSESKTNKNA